MSVGLFRIEIVSEALDFHEVLRCFLDHIYGVKIFILTVRESVVERCAETKSLISRSDP